MINLNSFSIFNPTDSYYKFKKLVPERLSSNPLVVVHHNDPNFDSTRWTCRTRDIFSKRGKKLEFDCCVAYLVDNVKNCFQESEFEGEYLILGYRYFGDNWVKIVDTIDIRTVSFIEFWN